LYHAALKSNRKESTILKSFLELCLYGFIQGRNQISIGLIFWILMLLWLAYGFRNNYAAGRLNYRSFGGHALLWVLLFLLGWQAFGFPVGR